MHNIQGCVRLSQNKMSHFFGGLHTKLSIGREVSREDNTCSHTKLSIEKVFFRMVILWSPCVRTEDGYLFY